MPLDFGKGLHEDSCYRTKSNLKRDFSTWCQCNVRKLSFLRLESLCAAQEIIPETAIIIHAFRAMWSWSMAHSVLIPLPTTPSYSIQFVLCNNKGNNADVSHDYVVFLSRSIQCTKTPTSDGLYQHLDNTLVLIDQTINWDLVGIMHSVPFAVFSCRRMCNLHFTFSV